MPALGDQNTEGFFVDEDCQVCIAVPDPMQ